MQRSFLNSTCIFEKFVKIKQLSNNMGAFFPKKNMIVQLAKAMKSSSPAPNQRMGKFKVLQPADAPTILPGTVMFLPSREVVPKLVFTDPALLDGAFNHPVVILDCPKPTKHDSRVEFAIVSQKFKSIDNTETSR
jgi:hypothetical protein